jgi:hypothetical protein
LIFIGLNNLKLLSIQEEVLFYVKQLVQSFYQEMLVLRETAGSKFLSGNACFT